MHAFQFLFPYPVSGSPVHGIADDLTDGWVEVGAVGFMTGLEIEDPAVAAGPGTSGAEHLAATVPT